MKYINDGCNAYIFTAKDQSMIIRYLIICILIICIDLQDTLFEYFVEIYITTLKVLILKSILIDLIHCSP